MHMDTSSVELSDTTLDVRASALISATEIMTKGQNTNKKHIYSQIKPVHKICVVLYH